MRLDCSHKFKSKHNNIVLIAEELEELSYGRMFWKFSFLRDDIKFTNELLKCKNEGLFTNLDKFSLESINGNYIYIPKYNPVIYEVKTNTFREFKAPIEGRNNHFIKNIFTNDELVILHERSLCRLNLINGSTNYVQYPLNELKFKDITIEGKSYMAIYKDLEDYKEYKKVIEF